MNQTNEFETYLKETVLEKLPSRTKEAMCYSLMNGGKRVRPQLLFAALQHYGMDPKDGFACACAIEMIHTYSLILCTYRHTHLLVRIACSGKVCFSQLNKAVNTHITK